jgi:hypothetical protein
MLLDETKGWKYVGSETTCETNDKTKDETIVKHWMKRSMKQIISKMKKTTLDLLYPWKTMDRNISSPYSLYFSESKTSSSSLSSSSIRMGLANIPSE